LLCSATAVSCGSSGRSLSALRGSLIVRDARRSAFKDLRDTALTLPQPVRLLDSVDPSRMRGHAGHDLKPGSADCRWMTFQCPSRLRRAPSAERRARRLVGWLRHPLAPVGCRALR
jgi:hypothetical protein